jgi:hypothetical protein
LKPPEAADRIKSKASAPGFTLSAASGGFYSVIIASRIYKPFDRHFGGVI